MKNKKLIITLSIIFQYILVQLAAKFPKFIDEYYSRGLYQVLSKLMRYTFGWISFSVGDVFIGLLIVFIIRWLVSNRKRILNDTLQWFLDIGSALSIAYFAFYILWGLNYYRQPIHKTLGISDLYTTTELIKVTKQMIDTTNAIHFAITKSDTLKVVSVYNRKQLLKMSTNGYENLKKHYPSFKYNTPSVKLCQYSVPQAYMGFSGYINPFTNEAQVNYLTPIYSLPNTICHEIAHQLGYAAENEANFIGNLAAISNENRYVQYAGYTSILKSCLIELSKRNKTAYNRLIKTINKGVLKNYAESKNFWNSYKNPFEPYFKKTYNVYLKANNQSRGIESYSYVVALLVNYFK